MTSDLFVDEPVMVVSPPPNCIVCGRFVDLKIARRHLEMGDYGAVLSCEFECHSHREVLGEGHG